MPRPHKHFKPVTSYSNRAHKQILVQLELHREILHSVRYALPDNLAAHIIDCVLSDGNLLVYTHSAAWASQLRFYSDLIKNAAGSKTSKAVKKVQIRIFYSPLDKHFVKPTLSIPALENIELIRNNADNIVDKNLKHALVRLSNTLKKHHEDATASP